MVMECFYCGEKANKHDSGRTFHKFPFRYPKIMQSWINNMGLGSDCNLTQGMRLCSDHFEKECFRKAGTNVMLVDGSIPTRFGFYKSACIYCKSTKMSGDQRTFHKFPHKNPVLFEKWVTCIGSKNRPINKRALLCSDHFDQSCFRPSGVNSHLRLRNHAIPSLFEPLKQQGEKRPKSLVESSPLPKYSQLEGQDINTETVRIPSSYATAILDLPNTSKPNTTCGRELMEENVSDTYKTVNMGISSTSKSKPMSAAELAISNQASMTPNSYERISLTQHDHSYEDSPRTIKMKLMNSRKKIMVMKQEARVHKQQISRLKHKIATLKNIVSELRKTHIISDSRLTCMQNIAEADIFKLL